MSDTTTANPTRWTNPMPDSTGANPAPMTFALGTTNPIPPSCLAQVPDGTGDETGKVHVCALYAGHDYVPNDHSGAFWHRCACGAKFTQVDDAEPATT